MIKIQQIQEIAPSIFELVVEHPRMAQKALAGHFVIVMTDEQGERIPLTIADYDAEKGTITLVVMAVGTTTKKLCKMKAGDELYAMIGPLGHASEIANYGSVILVAGGVGTAPVYPIAKSLKNAGNRVITIQGARESRLLFWTEKLKSVSDLHIVTTDDGSFGRKGRVTEPLLELLQDAVLKNTEQKIARVYAIGPAIMMKFCAETSRPFGVPTIASLNSVMIDGTGMCGGCRVKVGNETKFTCVDGPEFDAHAIDWDVVLSRQNVYHKQEECSLNRFLAG